jgi:hypothetical protein
MITVCGQVASKNKRDILVAFDLVRWQSQSTSEEI